VRVVIVGGGFGGLQAAHSLRDAAVEITLVDARNFHLFQPLAYQVATGALDPAEIAAPLRSIFRRQRNVHVLLAEVTEFDLARREVHVTPEAGVASHPELAYDALVVAAGSRYSYFGHDDWRAFAPELKSIEGAIDIRSRIFSAFEAAELETDAAKRRAALTFVVVGAGPTGVEMAGQIAELAHDTLREDFRNVDTRQARVLLVELADRVLTSFAPSLSAKGERALRDLGVTPLLRHTVVDVTGEQVVIEDDAGRREVVPTRTVIWAAGVTASPLAGELARAAGLDTDHAGRVTVEADLTLPGHPEVFAIGDMAQVRDLPLPGLAPVAMQQGRYVARVVRARADGDAAPGPFRYVDKGNLATIGRSKAVAEVKGLRLSGVVAWWTWLVVHLFYLIGFHNRLVVLVRWTFSFFTHGRSARLITRVEPRD